MSWGKTIFGGTKKLDIIPLKSLNCFILWAGLDGIDFSQIPKSY